MHDRDRLTRRVRVALGVVIFGLVGSGVTAFPLLQEVEWLAGFASSNGNHGPMHEWLFTVRDALRDVHEHYAFLAYGTDWLAFAHLVIALFFIGPFCRPAGDRSPVVAGMVACGGVVVLALTCGPVRGIPLFWRLIDCSFGVVGFVPLWIAYRAMGKLQVIPLVGGKLSR